MNVLIERLEYDGSGPFRKKSERDSGHRWRQLSSRLLAVMYIFKFRRRCTIEEHVA